MSSVTNIHDHIWVRAWPRPGFWFPPWGNLWPFEVTGRSVHLQIEVYQNNFYPIELEVWQCDPVSDFDNRPDYNTLRPIEVPVDECKPWGPTERLKVTIPPELDLTKAVRLLEVSFPNCAKFYVVRPTGLYTYPPVHVFALLENLRTKG